MNDPDLKFSSEAASESQTNLSSGSASGLPPQQPISPPLMHSVFVGPEGLRVPWRLLLYLLMGLVVIFILGGALRLWHPHGGARLWAGLISEALLAFSAIVSAFIMARIENRPFGIYGLPGRQAFRKHFWIGAAWGLVSLSILLLMMRAAGAVSIGGLQLHGVRILKFAAFYAGFFLLVGFFEEFLMRGYTQYTLTQGIGFWPSAVILSLAFGALHLGNGGEAWLGILAAALIGFFFCLTLRRTGTLWWAVGFHMSWDWAETYLYAVPNSGTTMPGHLLSSSFHGSPWLSGGSVGPEGSVLAIVTVALLWIVFERVYPQVRYPG